MGEGEQEPGVGAGCERGCGSDCKKKCSLTLCTTGSTDQLETKATHGCRTAGFQLTSGLPD